MASHRTAADNPLLDSQVRQRIVAMLENDDAGLTVGEVAEELHLHTSTARFHCDQLAAAGLVATAYERRGVGRPRKVFMRAQADPASPSAVRDHHGMMLLASLMTEIIARNAAGEPVSMDEAGARWAAVNAPSATGEPPSCVEATHTLAGVMTEWGYDPEVVADSHGDEAGIRLTHCPFRQLARVNPEVVCGIHRGIIHGTITQLGVDAAVELTPFADGDTCIARIAAKSPRDDSPAPTSTSESTRRSTL